MPSQVISPDTVKLNGESYKIRGAVSGGWLDPFPNQISIGDPEYSNRVDLSSWIMSDFRGGIGVEEMAERIDANKLWWTNCIIKFHNHILPPRLATSVTVPTPTITGSFIFANFNGELYLAYGSTLSKLNAGRTAFSAVKSDFIGAITALIPSLNNKLYIFIGGTSVASDTLAVSSDSEGSTQSTSWIKVKELTAPGAGAYRIKFDLRGSTAYGRIYRNGSAVGTQRSIDNLTYTTYSEDISGWEPGDLIQLYVKWVNTGYDTYYRNFRVYGTADNYWYMNTSGDFTESNTAGNWGKQFDAKLFKMNTSGTVAYSTDPDGATPTWTSGGAINDIASQIEGFVVGRDASGNITLYVPTNSILKAYDDTTPQWVDTEAVLPNHPIGGQGAEYFNGKTYLSYGLGVKEYYPETGAFIDIGLTVRDGLPIEYNGEVVKLRDGGSEGMFAAVDASVTSGNSKSGLYLYDGFGWQCWWIDTTNNQVMGDIIVSSASSGYAVYWCVGTSVYYIDIPRGVNNPDKLGISYATAGILLTPWFDAGNGAAAKLAKLFETFAKGVTATETVALKYRIDHTDTDLDTGWTTMDTLNTTGENGTNQELFASGAGTSIKAIQFRLDFVTGGSTAKADIQNMVFYYRKRTGSEKKRFWNLTVICEDDADGKAKQKVANLKTAIESGIDVIFLYHANDDSLESYYVSVNAPEFSEQTGRGYEANYRLQLIES